MSRVSFPREAGRCDTWKLYSQLLYLKKWDHHHLKCTTPQVLSQSSLRHWRDMSTRTAHWRLISPTTGTRKSFNYLRDLKLGNGLFPSPSYPVSLLGNWLSRHWAVKQFSRTSFRPTKGPYPRHSSITPKVFCFFSHKNWSPSGYLLPGVPYYN